MAMRWNDLQRIKRVEALANSLGFEFKPGEQTWGTGGDGAIYVKPKDELLPMYSRTATFFIGSIESIENWLDGIVWARHYDDLLKLSNDKKRERQEDLVRQQHLMKTIKAGKLVQGTVGSIDEEIAYADDGGTGAGY
jgi:hypothetical protein